MNIGDEVFYLDDSNGIISAEVEKVGRSYYYLKRGTVRDRHRKVSIGDNKSTYDYKPIQFFLTEDDACDYLNNKTINERLNKDTLHIRNNIHNIKNNRLRRVS